MASTRFAAVPIPCLFAFFLLFLSAAVAEKTSSHNGFPRGEERATHLHFFFHDIVNDPDPTAAVVAAAKTTRQSPTEFGLVFIADDPLTEGPERTSKLVGRAQGLYASASQEEVGLLMAMSFAFVGGEYDGSTLAVLGRNRVFSEVRELPIVGGSGKFRLARGYALARTHWLNLTSGDATVEYDVYVLHH